MIKASKFRAQAIFSLLEKTPPLVHKIFYIISTQRSYTHKKLDTSSCFAKLKAISNLFSFFYTPCIANYYNLLRRGKKLIKSATTVLNQGRPKNVSSKAAKSHLGKWLFCAKKPPKTEYEANECTHHQRKHVKMQSLAYLRER